MIDMIKRWLVTLGLGMARAGGWTPPECPRRHLPDDAALEVVRKVVIAVDQRLPRSSGPIKSREALRTLMNMEPGVPTRDLNFLIELAVQTVPR